MPLTRITALLLLLAAAPARAELPRTDLSYRIQVRIDPATRALSGQLTLRWVNRASSAVDSVPLHLYLNAFAHEQTTWMREAEVYFAGRVERQRFLDLFPDPWGWNEPSAIEQLVGGRAQAAAWRPIQPDDGNPLDRTLIQVRLPEPVPAGATLTLRVAFSGRLPVPVARTGCTEDFCLVAQWFPKIGVLQPAGDGRPAWAARQFHAPTEFFADFADYDVTIEAPRGWTVGATGRRVAHQQGTWQRVRYAQRAVHDFAIVLGRRLYEATATHRPPGGTPVRVRYLLPRGLEHQVPAARRAIQRTLDLFARRVGPYPYATLTVVMPPWAARRTGGMEYPTLITGSPADPLFDRFPVAGFHAPQFTLVHELGHQYFYGLLATNEQQEAFLDEGINSFWDGRAMRALFGKRASAGQVLGRAVDAVQFYAYGMANNRNRVFEPIRRRPAALFYPGSPRDQIYGRTALTLWTATHRFGTRTVDRLFAHYFERHRFTHPSAPDLLRAARETHPPLAAFLDEAFTRARVPDFRVVTVTSEPYRTPLGRVVDRRGAITVTPENRAEHRRRLTPATAHDAPGKLWLEITDPGWFRGGREQPGTVRWRELPARGAAPGKTLYESRARIVGPAWDHLPVTVLLRFADGAEVRERWDGRAAWRGYRAVRGARLAEVRIDPEQRITLDVVPQNNGQRLEPDTRFGADWSGWLTALAQWIAGGLSLWL